MTDAHDGDRYAETKRALESRDLLEGTVTLNGSELPIKLREPTLEELERIDEDLAPGADETDAIREIIDQYLAEPDVDPGVIGVSNLFTLFEAMRETWQGGDLFEDAEEAMAVEGNRDRTSRR